MERKNCSGCIYCILRKNEVVCVRYPKPYKIEYIGNDWCGEFKTREQK